MVKSSIQFALALVIAAGFCEAREALAQKGPAAKPIQAKPLVSCKALKAARNKPVKLFGFVHPTHGKMSVMCKAGPKRVTCNAVADGSGIRAKTLTYINTDELWKFRIDDVAVHSRFRCASSFTKGAPWAEHN